MSGEWLKFELSTPDKPEIFKMARILNCDKDSVIGKLIRVWAWFDRNSVDGRVDGVMSIDVDQIAIKVGFIDAMKSVGWADYNDDESWVLLVNFDRHNGETAKKRALKNKRQSKWRNKPSTEESTKEYTKASTKSSTREEKRREDNKYIPPIPKELLNDFLKVRKAKRAGELTETAFNAIVNEAKKANITVNQAIETCCLRGWVGFKAEWINKNEQPKIQQDKFLRNML